MFDRRRGRWRRHGRRLSTPVAIAIAALISSGAAAQDGAAIDGAWTVQGNPWGSRVAAPGGFPVSLDISRSPGGVAIVRNGGPAEVYRQPGDTRFGDGTTASATFDGDTLVLIIRRPRPGRDTPAPPLAVREVYRRLGEALTLERSHARGSSPDSPDWTAAQTVTYRRR